MGKINEYLSIKDFEGRIYETTPSSKELSVLNLLRFAHFVDKLNHDNIQSYCYIEDYEITQYNNGYTITYKKTVNYPLYDEIKISLFIEESGRMYGTYEIVEIEYDNGFPEKYFHNHLYIIL